MKHKIAQTLSGEARVLRLENDRFCEIAQPFETFGREMSCMIEQELFFFAGWGPIATRTRARSICYVTAELEKHFRIHKHKPTCTHITHMHTNTGTWAHTHTHTQHTCPHRHTEKHREGNAPWRIECEGRKQVCIGPSCLRSMTELSIHRRKELAATCD